MRDAEQLTRDFVEDIFEKCRSNRPGFSKTISTPYKPRSPRSTLDLPPSRQEPGERLEQFMAPQFPPMVQMTRPRYSQLSSFTAPPIGSFKEGWSPAAQQGDGDKNGGKSTATPTTTTTMPSISQLLDAMEHDSPMPSFRDQGEDGSAHRGKNTSSKSSDS